MVFTIISVSLTSSESFNLFWPMTSRPGEPRQNSFWHLFSLIIYEAGVMWPTERFQCETLWWRLVLFFSWVYCYCSERRDGTHLDQDAPGPGYTWVLSAGVQGCPVTKWVHRVVTKYNYSSTVLKYKFEVLHGAVYFYCSTAQREVLYFYFSASIWQLQLLHTFTFLQFIKSDVRYKVLHKQSVH